MVNNKLGWENHSRKTIFVFGTCGCEISEKHIRGLLLWLDRGLRRSEIGYRFFINPESRKDQGFSIFESAIIFTNDKSMRTRKIIIKLIAPTCIPYSGRLGHPKKPSSFVIEHVQEHMYMYIYI